MQHVRNEIWDFVFKSGPQTIDQIAENLQLNQETVNVAVAHEWFLMRGDTVNIAKNQGSVDGQESHDV